MDKRALRLKRESLGELGTDDLRDMAGAATTLPCLIKATYSPACLTLDLHTCYGFTRQLSCDCHATDNC